MIDLMNVPHLIIISLIGMTGLVSGQYDKADLASDEQHFSWPEGKRFAISLTFDDARTSQIDLGIPLLDAHKIKATFYISPYGLEKRIEGWRAAALNGHEIGNHSMSHPCTGNYAFSRQNALENYTLEQMAGELDRANEYIQRVLNIKSKAFAYPCGQTFVGYGNNTQSYVPLVADRFTTGRKWLNEAANDPLFCDMSQLLARESDQKTFDDLLVLIEQARSEGRWLILAGHEMADGGLQTTYLKTLQQLCQYANDQKNELWMDTVSTIADYILSHRKNPEYEPSY